MHRRRGAGRGTARAVGALIASAALAALAALSGCAPQGARDLTGDLTAHDPALARDGDTWYVYSTGSETSGDGNIQIRSSDDGADWVSRGTVWDEQPDWLADAVPGVKNLWAPELVEHDGTWYLYYSASTFGKNRSVIALATNTTLDPDDPDSEWVDRGEVIASSTSDDFNAIDAGVATDEDGRPWMAFGSFWSGIRMVPLEWPSGLRADDAEPLHLVDRGAPPNAVEAPYLVEHDGDWFLFVSRDSCCQGLDSTYSIAVGRADEITGPYLDRDGTPMLLDGYEPVLEASGDRIGPGGQSVYGDTMALHYYDARLDGAHQLALVPLRWDADGWPVVEW
ncbi:arabinan endo-1,5-alpha-L-arabinosidase [Agromyces sp. LHK192]|uniref:arabinan endo-1,5-alpha-L-arabinosidase n=1 Tax=Agromyces sp. LHK192 TaxID=2498704 RepID=UPI001F0B75A0|nr:arabinan endo-1,5-alpha-L-arabinosidase [Agromyces sp. LHK192]